MASMWNSEVWFIKRRESDYFHAQNIGMNQAQNGT